MSPNNLLCRMIIRLWVAAVVAIIHQTPGAGFAAERPNVLIIVTDDQGWGDIGSHGNTDLSTPNLDALAARGARFSQAYVCPVCSPTRCELLTGRYHARAGVSGVSEGQERMAPDVSTIADDFTAAGYRTALFGKWHNGTQHPYHPNDRGFQEFFGFTSGHWGHYFSPRLDHNGRIIQGIGYLSDDFTARAIDYFRERDERPFFAIVAYNSPHSPMQVPDHWWEKWDDRQLTVHATEPQRQDPEHTRAAYAMVENLDWNVGRLLESLRRSKTLRDTIVVFMSDNGPNGHRFQGGLRGIKGSVYEGGVRTPLFISYPKAIARRRQIDRVVSAIDLRPTLLELCNVATVEDAPFDGRSFASDLTAPTRSSGFADDRTLWHHWNGKSALRVGKMKFVAPDELYDIAADPHETKNLAGEMPDKLLEMKGRLSALQNEMPAPSERPLTIGYTDQADQLPCRDAKIAGGVKRSSKHPNCSYVTHWTDDDDRIVWRIDAARAGHYQVRIWYTCPQASIPSRLRLTSGAGSISFAWPEAADPPVLGAAEDRVPRSESYWKDFSVADIGQIELRAGPQDLALQAETIAGGSAGEVALMTLERVD